MPPNVTLMVLPLAWWWGIATNSNILTRGSFPAGIRLEERGTILQER